MTTTTKTPSRSKQATIIMKHFDFERMAKTMKQINWTWSHADVPAPPTVAQLKEVARDLLDRLIDYETVSISTGGFHAYVDKYDWICLDFVVTSCDARYYLGDN